MALIMLFASGAALTLITLSLLQPFLPKQPNFAGRNIPTSTGLMFMPIILLTAILDLMGIIALGEAGPVCLAYFVVACIVGFVDDLWGGVGAKGFRGHLGALARGRVTTGIVKVVVFGGGALVVGFVVWGFGLTGLISGVILAGSANLANLFDIRPGRALKFFGVCSLSLLFVSAYGDALVVVGVFGGAAALFYFDLRERIMLGDAGAAIIGTVPGYLVLVNGPGGIWWISVLVILGLTVLAEISSISRLIQEVGALRWFDEWGRGR